MFESRSRHHLFDVGVVLQVIPRTICLIFGVSHPCATACHKGDFNAPQQVAPSYALHVCAKLDLRFITSTHAPGNESDKPKAFTQMEFQITSFTYLAILKENCTALLVPEAFICVSHTASGLEESLTVQLKVWAESEKEMYQCPFAA
jgi:hypothetical protein